MFTITHNDQTFEIEQLHNATRKADALARQDSKDVIVAHGETGVVVYATNVVAQLIKANGGHFNPWTRIEVPKFSAPSFEGFTPAYTRKRIGAAVYRRNDWERGAAGNWRVFDGRTGKFRDVANTKSACALTTAMRTGLML